MFFKGWRNYVQVPKPRGKEVVKEIVGIRQRERNDQCDKATEETVRVG